MDMACDNCGNPVLSDNESTKNTRIYKRGVRWINVGGKKFVLCPKCVEQKKRQLG